MENGQKLSEESARAELQKFYDYYEIEIDELDKESEDSEIKVGNQALKKLQTKLLKAIMKGKLEFEDNEKGFFIIQNLRNGQKLTYKEIDGQAKTEMGKKREKDYNGQCYALLGYLCGGGEYVIKQLKGPELSLAEAIGTTLLLS